MAGWLARAASRARGPGVGEDLVHEFPRQPQVARRIEGGVDLGLAQAIANLRGRHQAVPARSQLLTRALRLPGPSRLRTNISGE